VIPPGSESAHLSQWLSRRVGYALRAPDLDATGLKLIGGRLLPSMQAAWRLLMDRAGADSRAVASRRPAAGRRAGVGPSRLRHPMGTNEVLSTSPPQNTALTPSMRSSRAATSATISALPIEPSEHIATRS